jgi:hypothetical protein
MDATSIVVVSVDIVSTCGKVSGCLSWLTKKLKKADPTLGLLRIEIDSLSQVLGSISTSFSDPSLARSALTPQTGHEPQHWRNVKVAMDDCKGLVEKINAVLERMGEVKHSGGIFQKSKRMTEPAFRPEQIAFLMQHVLLYRKTMEICLQLITLYVPDSNLLNILTR